MTALSDTFENRWMDFMLRGQALGLNGASAAAGSGPTNTFVALFRATAGQSPRSTAVSLGQTTVPAAPNGRMYRCTTAGNTGASEPTWPTTSGGTVVDGTVTWTEMTPDFEANNATVQALEVSGNGYTRATVASTLANWAGTQGAGTTTASTGTSGQSSNNNAVNFPNPTGPGWGMVGMFGVYDTSAAGILLFYGGILVPKVMNPGEPVSMPAGSLTFTIG